ncbi:MAG TPA: PKD domain-containing protein, partial [Pirellulales bacterium]|nr:PKD domain-containing protein [Pirellulales bacterium]
AQNTPLAGEGAAVAPTEGASFSGTLATFASSNTTAQIGDFTATIDWGDGATSAGTVVANPEGGFNVLGAHTYAEEATDAIHVTVADNASHTITIVGSAKVADAPLAAAGASIKIARQDSTPIVVATFTDAGGAESLVNYTATINWGDGSATTSGTITVNGGTFSVTGSHAYQKPGHHTITVTIKDEGGSTVPATSQIVVGSDHERLVEKLFEDLLDRDVDDGALAFFVGLLDSGTPASTVVAQLEQSAEFLADEVQTLFQQLLHRHAEAGAVSFFGNVLASGGTADQVKESIVSSPEYFRIHGGGDAQAFLSALFQDELNRGIDPAAEAFFSKLPLGDSNARAQVAAAIFASSEFLTDLVESDFETLLGRPADSQALNTFVQALGSGMDDEQLLAVILGSQEFAANS